MGDPPRIGEIAKHCGTGFEWIFTFLHVKLGVVVGLFALKRPRNTRYQAFSIYGLQVHL